MTKGTFKGETLIHWAQAFQGRGCTSLAAVDECTGDWMEGRKINKEREKEGRKEE